MYLSSFGIASSLFSILFAQTTYVFPSLSLVLRRFKYACCRFFRVHLWWNNYWMQNLSTQIELSHKRSAVSYASTTVVRQKFCQMNFGWKHLRFTMCLSNSQFTHTHANWIRAEIFRLVFRLHLPFRSHSLSARRLFRHFFFHTDSGPDFWVYEVPYALNVCDYMMKATVEQSAFTNRMRCSSFNSFSHVSNRLNIRTSIVRC